MKSVLEAVMILCFGISWPISVLKTYRTKSAKGKSLPFLVLIFVGYLFGLTAKIFFDMNYVFIFYLFNTVFVGLDILLFLKYRRSEHRYD